MLDGSCTSTGKTAQIGTNCGQSDARGLRDLVSRKQRCAIDGLRQHDRHALCLLCVCAATNNAAFVSAQAYSMTRHEVDNTWAARFVALWERCRADAERGEPLRVHATLCEHYGEAVRRYHTLEHIRHCLREFDAARPADDIADAVEMALWFHDVIFVPGAQDNEQLSADCFRELARDCLPPSFIAEVERMIMATTHRLPPRDRGAAWAVDLDLSSFGLPWPTFLRDSRHVREEMSAQCDDDYYPAHGRFLRGLCARERIYTTEVFHARYEQAARDNITRLLDAYAAGTRL